MGRKFVRLLRHLLPGRVLDTVRKCGEPSLSLPCRAFRQLVTERDTKDLQLGEEDAAYGDMPRQDLEILCRLLQVETPSTIFEIGTFRGATTLQLAAHSRARVFTLDLPPGHELPVVDPSLDVYPADPGVSFRHSPLGERIVQLFGNSMEFNFSPYHGEMDLVLVDGNHNYEYVRRDSESALRMRSPGGVVLWHDYAPYAPGVVRALHELAADHQLWHIEGTNLVLFRPGDHEPRTAPPAAVER